MYCLMYPHDDGDDDYVNDDAMLSPSFVLTIMLI